jgi:hypothetical protein
MRAADNHWMLIRRALTLCSPNARGSRYTEGFVRLLGERDRCTIVPCWCASRCCGSVAGGVTAPCALAAGVCRCLPDSRRGATLGGQYGFVDVIKTAVLVTSCVLAVLRPWS